MLLTVYGMLYHLIWLPKLVEVYLQNLLQRWLLRYGYYKYLYCKFFFYILPLERYGNSFCLQEALRSRGLKDDTTCLIVDIIPHDHLILPQTPKKKQNLLNPLLIFGKRSQCSTKGANKSSVVGDVEELFEEGSAMLAERYVYSHFHSNVSFFYLLLG